MTARALFHLAFPVDGEDVPVRHFGAILPVGNALELKAFGDLGQLFAR
jgi:extradiol dioxygenase family protein